MDTATRRKLMPMEGGRLRDSHDPSRPTPGSSEQVFAYHQRTKHRLERYAAGPEALDWSSQPDPFRTFATAPRTILPLGADHLQTPYSSLLRPGAVPPQPLSLASIGLLLELSLGLSAWKEYGPDRWALRCNPSSGNLHPTEGYLVCQGVADLEDGVYHYLSSEHVLEQRCRNTTAPPSNKATRLFVGLTSIHWREAWKYGERAFRYCQLDTGHALGALRYAAAALGWRLQVAEHADWGQIRNLLGLDRDKDFSGAESEEAELLLEVHANCETASDRVPASMSLLDAADREWHGQANVLDPHPMYHWPVIDEVAEASRMTASPLQALFQVSYPPLAGASPVPVSTLVRQRRSAQQFDGRTEMSRHDFFGLLDSLLPRPTAPWDVWSFSPRVHPVFFVHRVEDIAPGLYVLLRNTTVESSFKTAMREEFDWRKPDGCPGHLPFFRLAAAGCGQLAKAISCHQAIASDSAFALGMLTEFEGPVTQTPWRYRQLHWEAGLLGQVLYLEAEARGFRGTGIGCYFDDVFHELLGLTDRRFQSLYHFTVGTPLTDTRILTLPPYPARP
ncbi:MAG: hypothetical protein H6R26_1427 [Proteobacteria bacterium]|nr:hypothetical protein [Pseudomonadota bacterium]